MPLWAPELARLLLSLCASAFSLGAVVLSWKAAWTARGYAERQELRLANEARIIKSIDSLVEAQKESLQSQRETAQRLAEMGEKIWVAIGVHSLRLNTLEEKVGGATHGTD